MPRTARASVGGICYHVINRGNRRAEVFHNSADYRAFIKLMQRACVRLPMRVLSYCLMPNHFHFVLWPHEDGDLSRWMQWLMTSHVRRYHKINGTDGRIWQGRFKAFPIEQDGHLLRVLRYVERNPLRANLVTRAELWRWSSLPQRLNKIGFGDAAEADCPCLFASPVPMPEDWRAFVNHPESSAELDALRQSVNRERPFGALVWQQEVARKQ